MPSPLHEILIELFRDHPQLVSHLLGRLGGVVVPPFTQARASDATLRVPVPAEFSADLLLLYEAETPVLAVILEVQRRIDPDKERRWPAYVASVHDRHRCPAELVVVTPVERVGVWARGPFHVGSRMSLMPTVISPSTVPHYETLAPDERTAAMSLLCLGMHARGSADVEWVRRAIDPRRPGVDAFGGVREYLQLALALMPRTLRALLEEHMRVDVSDIVPFTDVFEERGYARGIEKGIEKGIDQGIEKGIEKGRLEGLRDAIVRIGRRRGWALSPEAERRLSACTDHARLEAWLDRALTAGSLDEAID